MGAHRPGAAGGDLPRLYPAGQHRGQKREHLDWLMAHVPAWAEHFGDGFGGTGIVAWRAKTLGMRVSTNDVMAFAHLRARAIIVNCHARLNEGEVDRLCAPNPARQSVAERWYGASLGVSNAAWLDSLAANLLLLDDPVKRDLAAFAAIIAVMAKMNYPQVTFTQDRRFTGRRYLGGFDWEREFRRHALDVIPRLIHDNGKPNEAHRGDALEFVRSRAFDVLYLDPPFASAAIYEHDLAWYDKLVLILEGRHRLIADPYNGPDDLSPHASYHRRNSGLMALDRLFGAARARRIILSYNTTSAIHPDEIARDGERIYGRLVAREERTARIPTVNPDRPRHTSDVLLVFDRR